MQIQFTARRFDASNELRTYAEQKLAKLLRFYDGVTDATIVLSKAGNGVQERTAEISLRVVKQTLTARDTASTHEEAIDNTIERLRRQLMRYKAKSRSTSRYAYR